MIEEALTVIENYLSLVRGYLPDRIAIDVIEELRAYIIEAAEEEGKGVLSVEVAKRTVARFGAPSEVAEEYKESMMLADDEDPSDTSYSGTHLTQGNPPSKASTEMVPREIDTGRSISNIEACFHFIFVASILISLTALPAGIYALIVAPIQFVLIMVFSLWIFFKNTTKGIQPSKRSYEDWPTLQRYFSFPSNFLPEFGHEGFIIESFLSALCIVLILLSHPILYAIIPFLLVRYWIMELRASDRDSSSYVRSDFIVELFTILIINFSLQLVVLTGFYWTYITPIASIFLGVLNTFLVVRLTAIVPDLWIDREGMLDDSELESTSSSSEVTTDRKGRPADLGLSTLKAIGMSILWTALIAFSILPLIRSSNYNSYLFVYVLLMQIPALIGLQLGNSARAKRKGTIIWDDSDSLWSFARRLLSFPKGVFLEQSAFVLRLDLLFTLLLLVASCSITIAYPFPSLIVYSLFVFATLMGVRFILLDQRWKSPSTIARNRAEYIINILILCTGTYIISMFFDTGNSMLTWVRIALSPYFITIWLPLSIYLLFSTVARGNSLWVYSTHEAALGKRTEEPVPSASRSKVLSEIREAYESSLGQVVGWGLVIVIISGIIILLGHQVLATPMLFTYGFGLILLSGLFIIGGFLLITIYFIWRRSKAGLEAHLQVIGKRTKAESLLDLLFASVACFFVFTNITDLIEFSRAYETYMANLTNAHAPIGIVVSVVYLILVLSTPILRIIADLGGIVSWMEEFSTKTIRLSSIFTLIFTGLVVGMSAFVGEGTIFEVNISGATGFLLILAVALIWQTITSRFRLLQGLEHGSKDEGTNLIEDLGHGKFEIPTN